LNVFKKAVKRYQDGILLNTLYMRLNLRKTGLIPFYLVQEGLFDGSGPKIEPRIGPLEIVELGRSDIPALAAKPGRDHSREDILEMLSRGCVCMLLRYKGDIAACMWYDLRRCSYKYMQFELADDEAYLYSARTFDDYRGKALAPYLRRKVYEYLATMGRTRLYSITLFENTPSLMFKKKLKARNLKLYLRVRQFAKHNFNILLRRYK
jgi:hypothetical protein